jgi:hypothetical protein
MNFASYVIISFLVFGILLALFIASSSILKKEKFEGAPDVRVCLFYATWCPHCVKYMDSKVFDNAYSDIRAKNSNIVFEKIDYEQNKNLAAKYDVNGFPSIIAVDSKGKKISDFKGDRYNQDALEQFALSAMAAA